jgi:hypothetical protein
MDESVNRNRYDSQEALIREIEADRDALRTELEAAQRRLEVACHIKAEDKVSFDFAVLDELAALREQARWIPVTERLPKECEDVLMANIFHNVRVGFYNGDRWIDNTSNRTPEVTHWRPLPPAPAEGGEG